MKKLTNYTPRQILRDASRILLGSILYAVAVNYFLAPNDIAAGGATGLATVMNHLWGLPIGVLSLAINLPLFLLGHKLLGADVLVKTVFATVTVSLSIDLLGPILPVYVDNPLIAGIFGGLLAGLGLGIAFTTGATTGGSDLLGAILKNRFPQLPLGTLILIIDAAIVALATLVYGDINNGLLATVGIYAISYAVNFVLNGLDYAKVCYVISDHKDAIAEAITKQMDRGVTLLDGTGAYTGMKRQVLFCVIRRNELFRFKKIVRAIDPAAFVVYTEATEVVGEGFKEEH